MEFLGIESKYQSLYITVCNRLMCNISMNTIRSTSNLDCTGGGKEALRKSTFMNVFTALHHTFIDCITVVLFHSAANTDCNDFRLQLNSD
jgi:hypothetical protein